MSVKNVTARKALAHLLDAAFDMTYEKTDYVQLGDEMTDFSVNLNPTVSSTKNIKGENFVVNEGYDVSSDVGTFFHKKDDALSAKILEMAMARNRSGWTSYVEVLLVENADDPVNGKPSVEVAWREDVLITPNSYGGDVKGVQAPFSITYAGNRVKGIYDLDTKKFTADGETSEE